MSRYGEIIYTRAGAAYDLRGEQLRSNNGYAVYSVARALFDGKSGEEIDFFTEKALQLYKYLACPVKSFYACLVSPCSPMALLGRYTPRTREDATRAAAAQVDTRASHVAQFLAGDFDRRPFEFMESAFFDAHTKPIADYYSRTCAEQPPLLNSGDIPEGAISREDILDFINDGRREAVMTCAAQLLEQNDGLAADQKTIAIIDEEPNVRMWIAAITSTLPLHIAKDLSFCTCARDLTDATSLRYNFRPGASHNSQNEKSPPPAIERRLLWRLAGAVPGDRTSQISLPVPPSWPLLVLNGKSKTAEFSANPAVMDSGLIQRTGSEDSLLDVFDKLAREMKDLPAGTDVCSLFDAVAATTSYLQLNYKEMLQVLERLLPHATPQSRLARNLEGFLVTYGGYENRFAAEDMENNLAMMRLIMDHADSLGWAQTEIVPLAVAAAESAIANPGSSQEQIDNIFEFLSPKNPIGQAVQDAVIGEKQFKCINVFRLSEYSEAFLKKLLNQIATYISSHKDLAWNKVLREKGWENVQALARFSLQREDLAFYLLKLASQDKAALAWLVQNGASDSGNTPKDRRGWWRTLARKSEFPPELICEIILKSPALEKADLDNLLAEFLLAKGGEPSLPELYKKHLGSQLNCGDSFRKACGVFIDRAYANGQPETIEPLLNLFNAFPADFKGAMESLDDKIDMSPAGANFASHLNAIARRTNGFYSRSACREFLDKCALERKSPTRETPASLYLRLNPEKKALKSPHGLENHQIGQNVLEYFAQHSSDPKTHQIAVNNIFFENQDMESDWLKSYAKILAKSFIKSKDPGLAVFCGQQAKVNRSASAGQLDSKNASLIRMGKNFTNFHEQCVEALAEYKQCEDLLTVFNQPDKKDKKNDVSLLFETWKAAYGNDALAMLTSMLVKAAELHKERHPSNVFKKLFGLFGNKRDK